MYSIRNSLTRSAPRRFRVHYEYVWNTHTPHLLLLSSNRTALLPSSLLRATRPASQRLSGRRSPLARSPMPDAHSYTTAIRNSKKVVLHVCTELRVRGGRQRRHQQCRLVRALRPGARQVDDVRRYALQASRRWTRRTRRLALRCWCAFLLYSQLFDLLVPVAPVGFLASGSHKTLIHVYFLRIPFARRLRQRPAAIERRAVRPAHQPVVSHQQYVRVPRWRRTRSSGRQTLRRRRSRRPGIPAFSRVLRPVS